MSNFVILSSDDEAEQNSSRISKAKAKRPSVKKPKKKSTACESLKDALTDDEAEVEEHPSSDDGDEDSEREGGEEEGEEDDDGSSSGDALSDTESERINREKKAKAKAKSRFVDDEARESKKNKAKPRRIRRIEESEDDAGDDAMDEDDVEAIDDGPIEGYEDNVAALRRLEEEEEDREKEEALTAAAARRALYELEAKTPNGMITDDDSLQEQPSKTKTKTSTGTKQSTITANGGLSTSSSTSATKVSFKDLSDQAKNQADPPVARLGLRDDRYDIYDIFIDTIPITYRGVQTTRNRFVITHTQDYLDDATWRKIAPKRTPTRLVPTFLATCCFLPPHIAATIPAIKEYLQTIFVSNPNVGLVKIPDQRRFFHCILHDESDSKATPVIVLRTEEEGKAFSKGYRKLYANEAEGKIAADRKRRDISNSKKANTPNLVINFKNLANGPFRLVAPIGSFNEVPDIKLTTTQALAIIKAKGYPGGELIDAMGTGSSNNNNNNNTSAPQSKKRSKPEAVAENGESEEQQPGKKAKPTVPAAATATAATLQKLEKEHNETILRLTALQEKQQKERSITLVNIEDEIKKFKDSICGIVRDEMAMHRREAADATRALEQQLEMMSASFTSVKKAMDVVTEMVQKIPPAAPATVPTAATDAAKKKKEELVAAAVAAAVKLKKDGVVPTKKPLTEEKKTEKTTDADAKASRTSSMSHTSAKPSALQSTIADTARMVASGGVREQEEDTTMPLEKPSLANLSLSVAAAAPTPLSLVPPPAPGSKPSNVMSSFNKTAPRNNNTNNNNKAAVAEEAEFKKFEEKYVKSAEDMDTDF